MIINIHPSAADNYNKKAGELLEFIIEYPPNRERQEEFSSHLHVAGSFTDKNIIGEIEKHYKICLEYNINEFLYIIPINYK